MGSSSRRPHRVPLLSDKNRKRRIQLPQTHQNWTIEDWKNVAWSDECRFLLRHSDDRVWIWHKKHESMDPSCLVSMVQAGGGGVMVWGRGLHFTQMASTVTRSQSNRAALGCGGTRDSHHGCADDKSTETVWCYHVNMDQNLLIESMPRRIKTVLKAKVGPTRHLQGVPNKVASECIFK